MAMTLKQALRAAIDDEYRARATYRAVLARYGDVRPFVNIVESEERHIRALERLFERYAIPVPPDKWAGHVAPARSLAAACEAGVEAERENGALYEKLMRAAGGRSDVEETFRRLLTASQENHLPAFERALARERPRSDLAEATRGRRYRLRRRQRRGSARQPGPHRSFI